mmetsp:Transcript_31899/g.67826  ORF Transcript_31899/g.67826 Transcript_31899/m.67826 type:complete len:429 (+) Transcript_31899:118-1404(+)
MPVRSTHGTVPVRPTRSESLESIAAAVAYNQRKRKELQQELVNKHLNVPSSRGEAAGGKWRSVAFVVLPCLIFLTVVGLFSCAYHAVPYVVWTLVVICSVLCLSLLAGGRADPFHFSIGTISFVALMAGVCVGFILQNKYTGLYWDLETGAEFRNVDPTSLGAAIVISSNATVDGSRRRGGTVLTFIGDTFVDDRRTIGMVWGENIYCVAPVMRQGAPLGPVLFWATGVNCCEKFSNFDCGTARDGQALRAVALHTHDQAFFGKAVRKAQSDYFMGDEGSASEGGASEAVANDVGLLLFQDPEDLKARLGSRAGLVAGICSLIFLIASIPMAVAAARWVKRAEEEELNKVAKRMLSLSPAWTASSTSTPPSLEHRSTNEYSDPFLGHVNSDNASLRGGSFNSGSSSQLFPKPIFQSETVKQVRTGRTS